jgi:hypothetical protein
MMSETSNYVLSNSAEAERLRVQARVWELDKVQPITVSRSSWDVFYFASA